jgi:hypothetical protein
MIISNEISKSNMSISIGIVVFEERNNVLSNSGTSPLSFAWVLWWNAWFNMTG